MKKYTILFLALVLTALALSGCRSTGNRNEGTTLPTTQPAIIPETMPTIMPTETTMPTEHTEPDTDHVTPTDILPEDGTGTTHIPTATGGTSATSRTR